MLTRTLYNIYKKVLAMLCLLAVVSCTDELVTDQQGIDNPLNQDKGIGELVLFSSGNTSNSTTRATIPYMEREGRFVCKMYYHAKADDTDASPFDTISTPITTWLRVNNDEGNSVYWQKDFDMTGVNTGHQDYLDYGFDSRAQYFYWRNRLDHIFLAYTDYNKLKSNTYGTAQGNLFMYPESDGAKKTKTGTDVSWPASSFRTLVFGMVTKANPEFDADAKAAADAAIAAWEEDKAAWESANPGETYTETCPASYDVPATIEVFELKKVDQVNTYPGGLGANYPLTTTFDYTGITAEQRAATMDRLHSLVENSTSLTAEERTALRADLDRPHPTPEEDTAEGTFRNDRWYVSFDPEAADAFDASGSVNFAAQNVAVYCIRQKKKLVDIIATAPANTFDMRRKAGMTKMADQPDPLIALTKMKPTGATQEANRVRLYFEHQFSQIQVNLTKGENTPELSAKNIVSVELLGVTEKGYVFTNINPDGTQIPPTYDPVVRSKYTDEQLAENPYGTSFNMFAMTEDEKPLTSLKSFNAIVFGQLQAIRITWKEEDYEDPDTHIKEEGVHHVATYKITVDDRNNSLVNLKSGYRYMYDFELRRGTIAFIRATIDGWLTDDGLNYNTSGTINE